MSNNLFKGVVKLTQTQFDTLKDTGTLTVGDETIAYSPKDTNYVVEDNLTEQVAENASAITSLQTEVATLESDVSSLQSSVQTNTSNITQLGTNKLDKNQGVSNAGKMMVVGDDGNIIPQTLVEGGTTVTVDGQAQTTWDADTKADVSSLSEVATSGSYSDLINKPTIPTDNSELTNGAGYATTSELNSAVSGKLDTNQGASNAGKVMTVGDDGEVVPIIYPDFVTLTGDYDGTTAFGNISSEDYDKLISNDNAYIKFNDMLFRFQRSYTGGRSYVNEYPLSGVMQSKNIGFTQNAGVINWLLNTIEFCTMNKQGDNYLRFNNIQICWGTVTPGKDGTQVTFPNPFDGTIYSIGATNLDVSTSQIRALAATNRTSTGFTAYGQYSQSGSGITEGDVSFTWIAIGY